MHGPKLLSVSSRKSYPRVSRFAPYNGAYHSSKNTGPDGSGTHHTVHVLSTHQEISHEAPLAHTTIWPPRSVTQAHPPHYAEAPARGPRPAGYRLTHLWRQPARGPRAGSPRRRRSDRPGRSPLAHLSLQRSHQRGRASGNSPKRRPRSSASAEV